MSLKAIATALGISVTTVSRALGGFSDVAGFAPIFPDTCYHLTHY